MSPPTVQAEHEKQQASGLDDRRGRSGPSVQNAENPRTKRLSDFIELMQRLSDPSD
jgi:hypothetical protein